MLKRNSHTHFLMYVRSKSKELKTFQIFKNGTKTRKMTNLYSGEDLLTTPFFINNPFLILAQKFVQAFLRNCPKKLFSNSLVDGLLTSIVLKSCDTCEPFHQTTLMSEDIALHCLQVCEKRFANSLQGFPYRQSNRLSLLFFHNQNVSIYVL